MLIPALFLLMTCIVGGIEVALKKNSVRSGVGSFFTRLGLYVAGFVIFFAIYITTDWNNTNGPSTTSVPSLESDYSADIYSLLDFQAHMSLDEAEKIAPSIEEAIVDGKCELNPVVKNMVSTGDYSLDCSDNSMYEELGLNENEVRDLE